MKKYFQKQDRFGDERIPICDKAVRRSFIETDKQRFVIGQYSEDIEWCCKFLLKNPMNSTLSESFYVYRQQVSSSISVYVGTKNILDILDVISRFADKDIPLPVLHFIANQYVLLITNFMRLNKTNQKQFENV